jgi:L-ascorbate metabolism protein UlaG (beta-lactamase superfamily)
VREIIKKSPHAVIVTHEGVGRLLEKEGIPFTPIADGEEKIYRGVSIQSFGTEHACIHHDLPKTQNTGFLINRRLFHPGDSFHDPRQAVEVLALPVAGPWMKIEEAIEYGKLIKPKIAFPIHDGMLRPERVGATRRIPKMILEPLHIAYVDMVDGSVKEF